MFSDYGRPFYQSGEIMYLDRLNSAVYKVYDLFFANWLTKK
jgi:hypothetical protein